MPTLPNGRSVVRFGAFEADLSSGEIHKHAAEPVLGAVQSAPGLTRPRPWWRKYWVAFVASAVTLSALLGLAVGAWRGGLVRSAHAMRIESVAVLPLENMTWDPTQECLVDGMTDALT